MFKKVLKIAITFGVLLAAHVGYVRLFAIVAQRALDSRGPVMPLVPTTFDLTLDNFGTIRRCRLVWRKGGFLGAAFED